MYTIYIYTTTYRETQTAAVITIIQSGVLTNTSSRRRGATNGRPLPERTKFGPDVAARQIRLCLSQTQSDFHPAMFSGNESLTILVASITRY